jgi:NhaA family Na+:H+ antiporter
MPLFALANTCVALGGSGGPAALLATPVAMGIAAGLLLGKPLGIVGVSLLGVKLGWAQWPTGMTVVHLGAVGLLGGIGFTMSLFLVEMSLTGAAAAAGKLAILVASMLAAILGAAVLKSFPELKPAEDAKVKLA